MPLDVENAYVNQSIMVELRKRNLIKRNIKSFTGILRHYFKYMRGKMDKRGIIIDAAYAFYLDKILQKLSRGNHE